MKKQIYLLLLALLQALSIQAYDFSATYNGTTFYFNKLDSDNIEVTYQQYSNYTYTSDYSGNITIPSSVDYGFKTYKVTSIGNSAFRGCSGLTSVTIPNSVTSIGSSAFYGCSGLTSVTIPDSVTSIGDYAFSSCTALKAFYGGLSSDDNRCVIINGVLCCFASSGLSSYNITNSVTSIGDYAFYGCSGLTSVTIPNSVTSIDSYAFCHCTGLTSVTIPNSVTSIGNSAFKKCSRLTSVTIPESVTSIGSSAFYYCPSLTSVTIPNSVTSIGDSAFYSCSSLTHIIIPASITSINSYAFAYCSKLSLIIYADHEPQLGNECFSGIAENAQFVTTNNPNSKCKALSDFIISQFKYNGTRHKLSLTDFTDVLSIENPETEINAGSYSTDLKINVLDSSVNFIVPINYSIEKLPITVNAVNCRREYGEANPKIELNSVQGFISGETVASVGAKFEITAPEATIDANVGTYSMTSITDAINYYVEKTNGNLIIEKAPITVTPRETTRTYGDPNPPFELLYNGLKLDQVEPEMVEDINVSTSATKNSTVGQYQIIAVR